MNIYLLTITIVASLRVPFIPVDAVQTGLRSHKGHRTSPPVMEIAGPPVRRILDPHGTWQAFIRHAERTNQRHKSKNAKGLRHLQSGKRGPPGQRGPRGPPGPAGALVTKDDMVMELQDMVREAAERRIQSIVDKSCENCNGSRLENITGAYLPTLFEIDEAVIVPKLLWGFHCRLAEDIRIGRRSWKEITGFYAPFSGGGFLRGEGHDPEKGIFKVSREGIYHISTNLRLHQKRTKGSKPGKLGNESLSVLICINSRCHRNTSLEYIVVFGQEPWRLAATVNGHLLLKKDDQITLNIDNNSSQSIILEADSSFNGVLIGL